MRTRSISYEHAFYSRPHRDDKRVQCDENGEAIVGPSAPFVSFLYFHRVGLFCSLLGLFGSVNERFLFQLRVLAHGNSTQEKIDKITFFRRNNCFTMGRFGLLKREKVEFK